MFGRNSDDDSPQQDADLGGVPPSEATPAPADAAAHENTVVAPHSDSDNSWQHPGNPLETTPELPPAEQSSAPAVDTASPSDSPAPVIGHHDDTSLHQNSSDDDKPTDDTPVTDDTNDSDLVDLSAHDLIEIKQKALGELNPLMSHLDQNPEEKFKTTMMMIQASDDQTLIKDAYAAAQQITDDKARAQALLDIVNEINYFTQQNNET
jgi:hypothetical protein